MVAFGWLLIITGVGVGGFALWVQRLTTAETDASEWEDDVRRVRRRAAAVVVVFVVGGVVLLLASTRVACTC